VEEEEEVDSGRMEKREVVRDLEGPHPPIPEKVRREFVFLSKMPPSTVVLRISVFITLNFDAPMCFQSLRYFSQLPIVHFVQQETIHVGALTSSSLWVDDQFCRPGSGSRDY
jgi:hypothetical protein